MNRDWCSPLDSRNSTVLKCPSQAATMSSVLPCLSLMLMSAPCCSNKSAIWKITKKARVIGVIYIYISDTKYIGPEKQLQWRQLLWYICFRRKQFIRNKHAAQKILPASVPVWQHRTEETPPAGSPAAPLPPAPAGSCTPPSSPGLQQLSALKDKEKKTNSFVRTKKAEGRIRCQTKVLKPPEIFCARSYNLKIKCIFLIGIFINRLHKVGNHCTDCFI